MDLVLVVGIIRSAALENAEKTLQAIGVRGITVTKVKGYGEYAEFLHAGLDDGRGEDRGLRRARQVERVADAIVDATHTGSPGDGIVAILPVERVISARSGGDAIPNWIRNGS